MCLLLSDKNDSKQNHVDVNKEDNFITVKQLIHQEDITFISLHTYHNKASK